MSLFDRNPNPRSRLLVWSFRICVLALLGIALLAARPAHAQETWHVDAGVNDGLIAHWRFDEGFGTVARDFVGTAHGTVIPNGAYTITVPNVGLPNNAAININTSRYISVTTNPAPPTDQFTISAWVKRKSAGSNHVIYDSGSQTNHWRFFISGANCNGTGAPNRLALGLLGVTDDVCASSEFPTDGAWHHVAAIKSGTGFIRLYIDGVEVGVGGLSNTLNTPTGTAIIGAQHNGTDIQLRFNGVLDDMRLYRRALSVAELQRLATGHGCVTDGTSWATAFRELLCALSEASPGDDIVIARGIYYPGVNIRSNFDLRQNLHLYGGYASGDALLPRPIMNLGAFPEEMTILSGDIDRNDDLDDPSFATYAGNTRRVVHLSAGNTTHLQGVQVRGGHAFEPGSSAPEIRFAQGAGMRTFEGSDATLQNVSFFMNQSRLDGAGVYAEGNLTVSDSGFTANESPVDSSGGGGGGGIYVKGTLFVSGSAFVDNYSDMPGGAIFVAGHATIVGSEFGNNGVDTFSGGAIAAGSVLTVTESNFVDGFAPFGGAAIFMQFGATAALVEDTVFESNDSDGSGGAIETQGASLTVRDSSFLNNQARARGGAISVSAFPTTTLLVEDSTFTGNQALGLNCVTFSQICTNGEGGAIASSASTIIRRSTFTFNFSVRNGGALILQSGGAVPTSRIEDSLFTSNSTSNPGITGVVNSGSGGAIYAIAPLVVLSSKFHGNFSSIEGGAIRVYRFDSDDDAAEEERVWLDVSASEFISNTSVNGGAILLIGNGSIDDSLFRENKVMISTSGAGIVFYPEFITSTLALTVANSTFAQHPQGAIYLGGENVATQPVLIANNLFLNNVSPLEADASDIFDDGPQTQILHNTFVRSDSSDFASIIPANATVIRNNIFYHDPAVTPVRPAIRTTDGSNAVESHNLFFNANIRNTFGVLTSQGGSISADPLFVDVAASNFHLKAASPARNVGTASSVTSDFEGDVRPIGTAPDMGYDEARFVPPVITPPANAFTLLGANTSFALGLFVDSDNDGAWQVTINWGDGSANTVFNHAATGIIPPQSHIYTVSDVYDVTITVQDAAGQTHQVTFQVTAAPAPTPTATATQPGNPATSTPTATPTATPIPNANFLPVITNP